MALAALAAAAGLAVSRSARDAPSRFRPVPAPGDSFVLMPESERTLQRIVMGVRPHGFTRASAARGATDARAVELRRRLFALDFELLHGGTMAAAPSYAKFFVAIPDPERVSEASGEEEADFRAYLGERLSWSEETIRQRVRFFRVGAPVLYPQDMGEILGLDSAGRLVLGVGADTDPRYLEPVERLAAEFPDDFTMRRLAGLHVGDVNLEGGDLALAWLPDGRIGILVGRHRVLRFVRRKTGDATKRPLADAEIDEARRAYSAAFFGAEATIVGEAALRDPSRGSEALFHADMVVATARNGTEALAFVPTYEGAPRDASTDEPLDAAFVADVQREYDLVAAQMASRGYRVVRLPYADHPVRSPVNVAKFVDKETGRPSVVLGRYPDHRLPATGNDPPSLKIAFSVVGLQTAVTAWEKRPDDRRWAAIGTALARVRAEMDAGVRAPNPTFDRQRALYEANGLSVVPLDLYPSGQGGVHCLLLR